MLHALPVGTTRHARRVGLEDLTCTASYGLDARERGATQLVVAATEVHSISVKSFISMPVLSCGLTPASRHQLAYHNRGSPPCL
eukprot:3920768-Pyramimonas_sp.AAC.1